MNIAVAGAGAVGCYFGGRLARTGCDVTFLARGAHLDAMKEEGLRVKEETGEYVIEGRFTDNIRDLSEADLVLFCVKSNDTKRMADVLQPILKETAAVMTLQNGVENEEILEEVFGAARVLSAVTYVQSSVVSPGEIRQKGRVKLVIGSLSSQTDVASIIGVLQEAGIDCKESNRIMARKWNKLMWNATFNPLSAVSGARVGEILDDEQLYKTAKKICEEVVEVGIRKGFSLDPEATISTIFSRAEFAKQHQTSMLQDRLRGKPMEVEAMCGYIIRQGELIGVDTPANQSIYSVLNYMNQKLM